MAVAAWKQCFKFCGYLCGSIAALNIWFWIGMTVFQSMGNPYITKEILLIEDLTQYDGDKAKDFVIVFAVCIAVSAFPFLLILRIAPVISLMLTTLSFLVPAESCLLHYLLLVHQVPLLSGQRCSRLLRWQQWRRPCQPGLRHQPTSGERQRRRRTIPATHDGQSG